MKRKEIVILVSIVLFDLITKLTANYYLPFQENVDIFDDTVSLYLTYNQEATGGQGTFMLQEQTNKNVTIILICVSGLILLSYFLFIRKKQLRTLYKVLIAIALYLTLSIAMELVRPYLVEIQISSWTTSVIGKLTGLVIYGTLFYLAKDRWIRFFALIILASGIGNFLSHFYLPYRIIDFIEVAGLYDLLRIGVFNIADLAIDIGLIGLLISVAGVLIRKMTTDKQKMKDLKLDIKKE